jgi:hypothetical protein
MVLGGESRQVGEPSSEVSSICPRSGAHSAVGFSGGLRDHPLPRVEGYEILVGRPDPPQWHQRTWRNENNQMPLASPERRHDRAGICTSRA